MYVGQYANGQKEGKGTLLFPNDSKYVGQFSKGKKHGPGMFFRADGTKKWSLWNMDQECKDEIGSEYSTDVASSYARSSTSGSSSSLSDGSSWQQQEAQSRVFTRFINGGESETMAEVASYRHWWCESSDR